MNLTIKILQIISLLMMSSVIGYCQEYTVLELPKIPSIDVQLETETAFISFSKDDLILNFEILKGTCGSLDKEWQREYTEAIFFLKESKHRIDLEENQKYGTSQLNSLLASLKRGTAIGLIIQKKASVIRKDTRKNQRKILFKSLADDELNYVFAFTDQSVFFTGNIPCTITFQ